MINQRRNYVNLGLNRDEIDQTIRNHIETYGVVQLYIDMITQDQAWGGDVELGIMSRLLNVQIIVHRPNIAEIIIGTNDGQRIGLDYNGNHYNLILATEIILDQSNAEFRKLSIAGNPDKDKKSPPSNSPKNLKGSLKSTKSKLL